MGRGHGATADIPGDQRFADCKGGGGDNSPGQRPLTTSWPASNACVVSNRSAGTAGAPAIASAAVSIQAMLSPIAVELTSLRRSNSLNAFQTLTDFRLLWRDNRGRPWRSVRLAPGRALQKNGRAAKCRARCKPEQGDARERSFPPANSFAAASGHPDKRTIERAQKDKRAGKAPTTQAGEFVRGPVARGACLGRRAIPLPETKACRRTK